MTAPGWTSLHAYLGARQDEFLLDTVRPVVEASAVQSFFYLRYWEGGPHLRLRARTTDPDGLYLRLRAAGVPADEQLDARRYQAAAGHAAALERRNEYDAVLRRPGTLEYGRYEPDHATYGRGEALDAVEEHFAESTTVALDVLDQPARTHTATAILTVLAFGATLGAPAVRHDLIDPGRLQHAWQTSRTELLPAFSAFHPDGNAPHQLWSRSACRLRDRLTALRPDRPDAVARALDKCLHLHLNRLGILSTQEAMLRALTAQAIADWGLCPAGRAGPRSGAEPGR